MDGQVGDPALLADLHILGELGGAFQRGGADHGDVGPRGQVLLKDLVDGQVDGSVAPGQKDVVLANVLQVVIHPGQGLHAAPVLAVAGLGVAEGGQDAQAAVLAAQVPVFAGAQVVQQGLIALVEDDAYIADAGVDHAAEYKVNHAVAAAEGQGAGVAGTGQLPQIGVGAVCEQDAVEIVHACSPPFTSSRIMALGRTVALSPTVTPPATTAMPQLSLPSGAAPTVAPDSTVAFSATME